MIPSSFSQSSNDMNNDNSTESNKNLDDVSNYNNSALVENIHKELAKAKMDFSRYKDEIKIHRETIGGTNIPNYYDYKTDLDFSKELNTLEDRKYYYRALKYQGIGLLRPIPSFKISLQDLSLDTLTSLLQFGAEERKYIIKQAVGRIFEDINSKMYHDSISSVLKVKLIDGSEYDYIYTEKEHDYNESDLQERGKIAQLVLEQVDEEVEERETEDNSSFISKELEN